MEGAQRQTQRALRSTVIALLALCVTSSPAFAQQEAFTDPAHDVVAQSEKGHRKAAPHRRDVDIREVIIRHGPDRIAMSIHVRDLNIRRFSMSATIYHKYTREAAVYPYVQVKWHPKHPHRTDVYIEWDLANCVKGPGPDKPRGRIRLHTNYRTNTFHLSFPRRCISGHPDRIPPWIRAQISMITWSTKAERFYIDEVSYPGTYPPSDTLDPVSPRVYAPDD